MSIGYMCWYWIYTANNWGTYVSWRLSVSPLGAGLGNVHYVIYIHWYWINTAKNWGIYVNGIYVLVLDIYCQQLGDIFQLEVVCEPFGRGVGECTLCDIYTLVLDISSVCFQMKPQIGLIDRMHSHIGCISLTFLYCVFLNESSNGLQKKMHNHIDCICLTFLQYVF